MRSHDSRTGLCRSHFVTAERQAPPPFGWRVSSSPASRFMVEMVRYVGEGDVEAGVGSHPPSLLSQVRRGNFFLIKFPWKVMKAAAHETRLLIFAFLASASGPHSITVTYGKLFSLI